MKTTVIKTTFQFKRATADRWEELNPILAPGEPGFELDTGRIKIGNGSAPWRDLDYIGIELVNDDEYLLFSGGTSTTVI